ncbi:MAG: histidine kinase [Flavobacteriaceae bacterium]|nr:histidine kinase [Flavobacteriaceae bacterium]
MKLSLFFLSFLIFTGVFSQVNDTLVFNSKETYTQEFVDSLIAQRLNPYKIEIYKKILESDNSLMGWPRYYAGKGNFVFSKDQDSCLYYMNKAIILYENSDIKRAIDEKSLIQAYIHKAIIYHRRKEFLTSTNNYRKALDLTKVHTYTWKGFILSGLAKNHLEIGNDSLALDYFKLAAKDSMYMTLDQPAIVTHTRIANIYLRLGEKEKALAGFNYALELSKEKTFKGNMPGIHGKLGKIAYEDFDMQLAETHFKKSITYYDEQGIGDDDLNGKWLYKGMTAFMNIRNNNIDEGIRELNEIVHHFDAIENYNRDELEHVEFTYIELAEAYSRLGNYDQARKIRQQHVKILNDFTLQIMEQDMQELEISYQTKEKDASIKRLEESKKQQDIIIDQQRYITIGIIVLLILGIISGLIFWRSRKIKNQYEKENLEQRLLRSQMNPHFISNALNVICGMVEKKSENTISYVKKLSDLFRLILNNSREEFVSLEDEVVALKNYLDLQSNFSKKFYFKINVQDDLDGEVIIIPPMLIQPFVENAIIHGINAAENGKIDIEISKNNELLECIITDNGIGYSETIKIKKKLSKESISGNIVAERLSILKKKFKVNTRFTVKDGEKSGTRIELYLPYVLDL